MNITLRLAFGNYAREITGVIVFNIRVSALGKMATAPLTREEINMHVFFPYVREHTNCKWTHTHTLTHTMTIYGFDKRPFYTLLRWRMREREADDPDYARNPPDSTEWARNSFIL